MGLLARVKSLSCTGVYRIRVLGNNCNLNCFESWGTTANRTLSLVFFAQTSPLNVMCSLEEEKPVFSVLLCWAVFLPSQLRGGKGSIALKSDLTDIKHINTSERHPGAKHSASSQDWKKSTT